MHPEHGGLVHLAIPGVHLSHPGLNGYGAHAYEAPNSGAPGTFHLECHPCKV